MMTDLDQQLNELERRVTEHNQRAASAAAQRQLLEQQRNEVIEQLKAEGITEISQLPNVIRALEQEIQADLQEIQSQLVGVM